MRWAYLLSAMIYRALAELVLVLHFCFVLNVTIYSVVLIRRRRRIEHLDATTRAVERS